MWSRSVSGERAVDDEMKRKSTGLLWVGLAVAVAIIAAGCVVLLRWNFLIGMLLACGGAFVLAWVFGADATAGAVHHSPPLATAIAPVTSAYPGHQSTTTTRTRVRSAPATAAAQQPCGGDPDLSIPAQEIPALYEPPTVVPDQYLTGHLVPGFTAGSVDLPAQVIPAQCVEIAAAPAGCLGAVTISALTIPDATLPAVTIPAIDVPGRHVDAMTAAPATAPAVTAPVSTTPETCAKADRPGSPLYQPITDRGMTYRPMTYRQMLSAAGVPERQLHPVGHGPGAVLPGVVGAGRRIGMRALDAVAFRELRHHRVDLVRGYGETAYITRAGRLFAHRRATLRRGATATLTALASSLRRRAPGRPIRVEATPAVPAIPRPTSGSRNAARRRSSAGWSATPASRPAGSPRAATAQPTRPCPTTPRRAARATAGS